MYLNIPNDDTQNYPSCTLLLVVETFVHHSTSWPNKIQKLSPKLLSQRIRESYHKSLGTTKEKNQPTINLQNAYPPLYDVFSLFYLNYM